MGNLGQDVDLRFMPDGRAVANLSVACSERYKDKSTGETKESTEWIRAVVFGKRAEVIAEYFKKGSQIHIQGKLRTRKYEKNGVDTYATEIVVNEFQFCGQKSGGGDEKAKQQSAAYGQQQGAPSHQEKPPVSSYDDQYNDAPYDDNLPFLCIAIKN